MSRLKLALLKSIFWPASILALPYVAGAAPSTWCGLVNQLVQLMNSGIATLLLLAFVIYFYGIATNILNFGGETKKGEDNLKQSYFFWGVIVIFVMVSVLGILRLLQNTLFGDSVRGPAQKTIICN